MAFSPWILFNSLWQIWSKVYLIGISGFLHQQLQMKFKIKIETYVFNINCTELRLPFCEGSENERSCCSQRLNHNVIVRIYFK